VNQDMTRSRPSRPSSLSFSMRLIRRRTSSEMDQSCGVSQEAFTADGPSTKGGSPTSLPGIGLSFK
jgi:hypothetical protein